MQRGNVSDSLASDLVIDDPAAAPIVAEFVINLPRRIAEMESAMQRGDWNTLRTLAHRLKGAGTSYGYPDLSASAAEIEGACMQQQQGAVQRQFDRMRGLQRAAARGLQVGTR